MDSFKTPKGTNLSLIHLKGKPYLEVQKRVVWFVEENSSFDISLEFPVLTDEQTVCKATITMFDLESEKIIRKAQAVKRETTRGFEDHLEKASTGAIGRALALLGYGTLFALEMDEGDRIVDAPAATKQTAPQPRETVLTPKKSVESDLNPGEMAVPFGAQKGKLIRMLNEKELQNNIDFWSRAESEKPLGPGPAKYLANLRAYQKTPKADPTFFEDDKL